jgi:hypothetical protein
MLSRSARLFCMCRDRVPAIGFKRAALPQTRPPSGTYGFTSRPRHRPQGWHTDEALQPPRQRPHLPLHADRGVARPAALALLNLDGEVVCCNDDGVSSFHRNPLPPSRRHVILYVFDLCKVGSGGASGRSAGTRTAPINDGWRSWETDESSRSPTANSGGISACLREVD